MTRSYLPARNPLLQKTIVFKVVDNDLNFFIQHHLVGM